MDTTARPKGVRYSEVSLYLHNNVFAHGTVTN